MSYRITMVCLGNICRSPIAEAVLRSRIRVAGLVEQVSVDSAGTGDWHLGQAADPRALTTLGAHGYQLDHRARQIEASWFSTIDLALAMDQSNFADLIQMRDSVGASTQIRMLRSFDPALRTITEPDAQLDVPDPYHGGAEGFQAVLGMIESATQGLVDRLRSQMLTA